MVTTGLNSSVIEVNSPTTDNDKLLTITKGLKSYFSISSETIKKYIPAKTGLRVDTTLMVLSLLHCTPASTMYHISDTIHCDHRTIKRSVEHLLALGLIRMMPQQRWIAPFNSYKQEKTWLITNKGKTVLSKLLDY